MEYFLQQLINGVTLGSIYGLIAIGYTMVYGIVQLINFAHGEIFMVGAFGALTVHMYLLPDGTSIWVALPLMLIGAMIVTLGFVLAFVAWRGIFRADVNVEPEPVDWLEYVEVADDAGLHVVHPGQLPDGWIATSVDLRAGDVPMWGMGVLTADGDFIGIRQEDVPVEQLVEIYVDEEFVVGEPAQVASDVASTWDTWSDAGGDHAFSTEIGDDAVLVYGSAPVADLEEFLGLLQVN